MVPAPGAPAWFRRQRSGEPQESSQAQEADLGETGERARVALPPLLPPWPAAQRQQCWSPFLGGILRPERRTGPGVGGNFSSPGRPG